MITGMDSQKLSGLIESFYNLTGIKVAVYDRNFCEILAYPEKDSDFCTMIHENRSSCGQCQKSTEKLCIRCAKKKEVIIEKCHAGLTEVIAPLTTGITVVGYMMFGQITNEADRKTFREDVLKRCREYKIDPLSAEEALSKIRYYSDKQLNDASKILDAIAKYIVFDKIIYPVEYSVAYEMTEYIRNNLDQPLTVELLCKKYFLSRTEIYKVTRAYMPEGIAAFIRKERIAKAAQLLAETQKSSLMIAEEIGFSDVNYFLRVFKKEKGMSAAAYRKKCHKC